MNSARGLPWGTVAFGLLLSAATAWASDPVYTTAQAKAHAGEVASVVGTVENVFTSRSGNEFLDLDGASRDAPFSAVIFAADAAKVGDLSDLQGKRVAVTGKITLYHGKPEIIVHSRDALKVR